MKNAEDQQPTRPLYPHEFDSTARKLQEAIDKAALRDAAERELEKDRKAVENQPIPARRTKFDDLVGNLMDSLKHLEATVDDLRQRLEPYANPETPNEAVPQPSEEMPERLKNLAHQVDRVCGLDATIKDLLNRLEV